MDPRTSEIQPSHDMTSMADDIKILLCQKWLNGADSFNLFRASPTLFFFPEKQYIAKHKDHPLRKLLNHGALGELEAAEAIWRNDPTLLTCHGTVFHPNRAYLKNQAPVDIPFHQNPGRYKYINRTFYQILLMNSEFIEAKKVADLMELEEIKKQLSEVFPEGEIKKYNWDFEKAKPLLQDLFNAIITDHTIQFESNDWQVSEATNHALYALYDYVKPTSEHEIGLVFDVNLYLEALELFENNLEKFLNYEQRAFWCIRVEEWLAGCLGTGYLRLHLMNHSFEITRSGCELTNDSGPGIPFGPKNNLYYFAFRQNVYSLFGYNLYVDEGCVSTAASRGRACAWKPQDISKHISRMTIEIKTAEKELTQDLPIKHHLI